MLSSLESRVIQFIKAFTEKHNKVPKLIMIQQECHFLSRLHVLRILKKIEKKGYIRAFNAEIESFEIVKDAKTKSNPLCYFPADKAFGKNEIKKRFLPKNESSCSANDKMVVMIPLYGKISAGSPIESFNENKEWIPLPPNLISHNDTAHYALRVTGDSMIDAGICDGDVVIIKKCRKVENDKIVVAMIDGQEVTLKRLRRFKNSVALEPANKKYKPTIYGNHRISIQGVLVGLLRQFS